MTIKRKSWWNKKYGKDSICPITKTRLRAGKNKNGVSHSVFLNCKHGFSRIAIQLWISSGNQTCPLCRRYINDCEVFL